MLAGLEQLCHQEAGVIVVASSAIEFCGGVVALIDLEMEGIHTQLPSALLDELHGAPANSLPAILRLDIQLIDEGIAPVIFETIAES